jgi:hypothetical protein
MAFCTYFLVPILNLTKMTRKEDLEFYKKISPVINNQRYLIPLPTLTVTEREQRRLAYRNERKLYKRKSSLSSVEIISIYHPDSPFTVFSSEEWWLGDWDPLSYGREYDYSKPFFQQFHELQLKVPRPSLVNNKSENSDYCNFADENKNCYLITSANRNRDCYYGFLLVNNKDTVDALWSTSCELAYECIDCLCCYNVQYAQNCQHCVDSMFLLNCSNLENCMLCINLKNKKYNIFNKQVTKEEYEKKLSEIRDSQEKYLEMKQIFNKFKEQMPIRRASNTLASENVFGNNIFNSKNVYYGFDVYECSDCAYLHDGLKAVDSQDIDFFDNVQLCYESTSLIGFGYRFTMFCRDSSDLFYCDNCHGCANCFGCVGLRNKKYCILNKQYTQTEYEEIVPRIIQHMIQTKEWGEFFPVSQSLFAYNETLAQEYFPLTKEEAVKKGYLWRDAIQNKIKSSEGENILTCSNCRNSFRLIKQEEGFYKKMGLPAPEICPDCRHAGRMKLRNPRKIYQIECNRCHKSLYSSYSINTIHSIYCDKCYLDIL